MPIRGMEDKRELDREKLKTMAFMDDLTGLYNRRFLYKYLPTELGDVKQLGKPLCMFMMDVDNFKGINDSYGHLCGDSVLSEIGRILQKSFRGGDSVIRYAGDEFIAVLPGASREDALNIAKRIIEKVDKNHFSDPESKTSIHVTVSIGIALYPQDAQDPEKLLRQADRALYSSKRSGRNRFSTVSDITEEVLDESKLQELFPCPKLISRGPELDQLKKYLDEAEKGKSNFILIAGERGMGKTRLLDEFKKYAQLKGITTIGASCSPEIAEQPYQTLIGALENLFISLGPQVREFIRSLPEAETTQLANRIPKLKEFLGKNFKAAQASSEDQAQTDLFKGICQTIIYAVKRNTCLLLIDDFHWIDQQTLQFFNYVIKSLGNIPILIVGALRQEELNNRKEKNSPQELLQKMRENKLLEEISLLHLEKEDVLNMVTVIFPQLKISQDLVDIVYDIGAGNPLFTEELLRSLVSKGFIFYQDGLWQARGVTQASLPPFLKEAVQKRVIELDEEAKPVVAAAAVVGEVFDFNILCQLLEKDSGYVLEVIDRVVKQHLIVPEGPFQTDKFKFKSGVIRDVIYTGLETQKKQQLHRKLAQLEEKMHPDNIDSVAGTIGYHFDKAQDKDRASLYSNMLLEKATRMPTYDDVFNFLQQSMLERVEEIVVPLSDPGMKLIPAAIRSLRLAAQNVRLYPPQSTVRNNFIQQAHKWLSDILDKDSTLIISTAENRLLVNGEEISEKSAREAGSAAFVALMINQRIKSITFKRNLTKEHLDIFLGYLSENYDKLMAEGGLSGILHKNEIEQIKVNEVRYEQTTKLTKQRTKFEEAMLIDYLLGKVSNIDQDKTELAAEIANDPKKLAQALKKVAQAAKAESGKDKTQAQANIIAKGLQKLSEQVLSQTKGGIEQYRKNIAEAMMALDYKVRSKVLAVQAEAVKTGSGDTAKAETKQASEQEILNKLSQEYSGSSDNLANVRQLMQRSLDPKRKQELLPRIKTELAGQGMGEEEISWVLEEAFWPGMSTEQKVQKAVKLSNDNYQKLQNQVSQEVQHLVAELLESGKYDQAREIIHKLIKQLESETQKLRSISLRDLKKITEMLIAKEKYFLLEEIINGLLPRLDQEKDPQIYSSCAEVLADISVTLIKRQSFIQASGILRELNLRLQNESKLLQIQKQAIRETKDKIIAQPALIDWLIKLLQTKIENRQEFWELCKVFGEIGQGSCAPLFSLAVCQDGYADPFSVYARRWGIAKVFNELKEEAVVYLKEKLNPQDQEAVKAAVELLGHLQNKNALQYLQPLVKAEDASIRKETVVAIGKIGGPEAIKLLSESVKDKDKAVRLACVWALANIGTKQALPLLKLLLQEEEFSQEIRKIIQRIEQKDK